MNGCQIVEWHDSLRKTNLSQTNEEQSGSIFPTCLPAHSTAPFTSYEKPAALNKMLISFTFFVYFCFNIVPFGPNCTGCWLPSSGNKEGHEDKVHVLKTKN